MIKMTLKSRLLVGIFCAASTAMFALSASAQNNNNRATHPFTASQPIPGSYIVVFKSHVDNPAVEARSIASGFGGRARHVFSSALKGFVVSMSDAELTRMRNNPNVAFIEQDQTISLNQISPQNQATWGLDRVDQVDLPLDTQYHFNYNGAGVSAFIIDTGIRADHTQFGGRVLSGFTSVSDGNGTNDCNGHGTHVAGTVGGDTYGIAKGVSLIPVRVLDCGGSGTTSGVIAGIDWAANSSLRPAVANLSLGGGASAAMDAAVAGAVAKGVTMVVAAGNSNANACNSSPARAPSAITVGATTSTDARASFSNFGSCVDIFGPGVNITSAWNTSPDAVNTISGTSMATPHVAGIAALALAANATASPAAVASFLTANATLNHISAVGTGSPNLLAFSLAAGVPTEPPVQAVAVKSITGQGSRSGFFSSNWKANATVTIRNIDNGAAVANATVSGSFSVGGVASCLTGSTGACRLTSATISRSVGSSVFSVTNVVGSSMVYDASQNTATQITILKP